MCSCLIPKEQQNVINIILPKILPHFFSLLTRHTHTTQRIATHLFRHHPPKKSTKNLKTPQKTNFIHRSASPSFWVGSFVLRTRNLDANAASIHFLCSCALNADVFAPARTIFRT